MKQWKGKTPLFLLLHESLALIQHHKLTYRSGFLLQELALLRLEILSDFSSAQSDVTVWHPYNTDEKRIHTGLHSN